MIVSMRVTLPPSLFLVWILDPLTVCNAFAPLVHSSRNPRPFSVAPQSPSELSMSNGFFLDRIENPEKVINQAVSEMQVRNSFFLDHGALCCSKIRTHIGLC
jgi:hypothetical protein